MIYSVALELTTYSPGLGGACRPLLFLALGLEHPISWKTKKAWFTVKGALNSRARELKHRGSEKEEQQVRKGRRGERVPAEKMRGAQKARC